MLAQSIKDVAVADRSRDALLDRATPPDAPAPPLPNFDGVYRDHFRFVWRTVRRLGIEGALVEDVVQDTFVVVHRRLAEFERRSSMETWLYGIVRRIVADHRRTRLRKPAHDRGGSEQRDLDTLPDAGRRSPDSCAEQAEQVLLLRRVLAFLDEEKREVFVLSELEGMTLAEIGEAIAVNANTVSSRLRAARREFEQTLDRLTRLTPDWTSSATSTASGSAKERRR